MEVETDDTALLTLFQNKATKNEGFKAILNKYSQPIYYFLRKMGLDHEDADELLQDAFIKFWKAPTRDGTDNYIRNTLFYMAAVLCRTKNTNGLLNGLTTEQSMMLILSQQEGFDFAEVAQITSVPVKEVRNSFNKILSLFNDQQNIKNQK